MCILHKMCKKIEFEKFYIKNWKMCYIDTTDRIETVEEVLSDPIQYSCTCNKIHVREVTYMYIFI